MGHPQFFEDLLDPAVGGGGWPIQAVLWLEWENVEDRREISRQEILGLSGPPARENGSRAKFVS